MAVSIRNKRRTVYSIIINRPVHEISNNVVCATSKASDQPAHTNYHKQVPHCRKSHAAAQLFVLDDLDTREKLLLGVFIGAGLLFLLCIICIVLAAILGDSGRRWWIR